MPAAFILGASGITTKDYQKNAEGLIHVEPQYFQKLSNKVGAKWQKRWFALGRNYMIYRKSEEMSSSDHSSTSIDLRSVISAGMGAKGKGFEFQLILSAAPGAKSPKPITFRVKAQSKSTAARWVAALQQRKSTKRNSMAVGSIDPEKLMSEQELMRAALGADAGGGGGEEAAETDAETATAASNVLSPVRAFDADADAVDDDATTTTAVEDDVAAAEAAQSAAAAEAALLEATATAERQRAELATLRESLRATTELHDARVKEVEILRAEVVPQAWSSAATAQRATAEYQQEVRALREELSAAKLEHGATREELSAAKERHVARETEWREVVRTHEATAEEVAGTTAALREEKAELCEREAEEARARDETVAQLRAELDAARLEAKRGRNVEHRVGPTGEPWTRSQFVAHYGGIADAIGFWNAAEASSTTRRRPATAAAAFSAETLNGALSEALGSAQIASAAAQTASAAAAEATQDGFFAISAMWRRMASAEEALLASTSAASAAFDVDALYSEQALHLQQNNSQRAARNGSSPTPSTDALFVTAATTSSPSGLVGGRAPKSSGYSIGSGSGSGRSSARAWGEEVAAAQSPPSWAMGPAEMEAWELEQYTRISELAALVGEGAVDPTRLTPPHARRRFPRSVSGGDAIGERGAAGTTPPHLAWGASEGAAGRALFPRSTFMPEWMSERDSAGATAAGIRAASPDKIQQLLREVGADPRGPFAEALHQVACDKRDLIDSYAFATSGGGGGGGGIQERVNSRGSALEPRRF